MSSDTIESADAVAKQREIDREEIAKREFSVVFEQREYGRHFRNGMEGLPYTVDSQGLKIYNREDIMKRSGYGDGSNPWGYEHPYIKGHVCDMDCVRKNRYIGDDPHHWNDGYRYT